MKGSVRFMFPCLLFVFESRFMMAHGQEGDGSSVSSINTNSSNNYTNTVAEGVPCGTDTCYHGSICVHGENENLYCDCSTTSAPGKHYAGKSCEYEATTYCGDNQDFFCVNNGECKPQDNGMYLCDCPKEWSGPSCEFESQNRDHYFENCTLHCDNGGECRKGAQDMSAILGLGPDLSYLVNDETANSEDFEHCVCPDGFTGIRCEQKYEKCGNGEHICLHGSKCVLPKDNPDDDENPVWTCACEESYREDRKYAGKYCQHHHTTTCTTKDAADRVYEGDTSLIFCVNDGVCAEYQEGGVGSPGCKCPDPWTGFHCELLKTDHHKAEHPLKKQKDSAAMYFFIGICSILALAIITIIVVRVRRSARDLAETIESAHITDQAGKSAIMEEVDFEDEALMEDIELL